MFNLCLAILLFLIIFVSGIESVESESTCVTVAAMLHYFVLVAVIWMGAEAFHLFVAVVLDSLPGELGGAFVLKCAVVAWGKFVVLGVYSIIVTGEHGLEARLTL